MFHKEGITTLVITLLSILILNGLIYLSDGNEMVKWTGYALSAFLLVTVLQFFRNPSRTIPYNESHVLSPADGKVVVIEEVAENEYFNEKRIQVSVFMSPVNVHVNRYPLSGKLCYFKYHPGKYLVAWHPKSSTENERTTAVVKSGSGKEILFRQIAGALARRIIFYGKEGEEVKQGEQCGFIKFGSRVDILLPLDAKVKVQLNQTVRGGESVIAEI